MQIYFAGVPSDSSDAYGRFVLRVPYSGVGASFLNSAAARQSDSTKGIIMKYITYDDRSFIRPKVNPFTGLTKDEQFILNKIMSDHFDKIEHRKVEEK